MLKLIALDRIVPYENTHTGSGKLALLVNDVRTHGMINPPFVKMLPRKWWCPWRQYYQILDGNYRLFAAYALKMKHMLCSIVAVPDEEKFRRDQNLDKNYLDESVSGILDGLSLGDMSFGDN